MDQASQLRNIIKKSEIASEQSARVITITSGKGGVGKSNAAINLAIQIRKLGKRVIIIDADFGLANIEIMFGISPTYCMSDIINKGKNIKEIITWGPLEVGFISGGSGIVELEDITEKSIDLVIKNLIQLDNLADVIIIDTGAGISSSVMRFLVASPEILLITTPEPTSITDSYSLMKKLEKESNFSRESTRIKIISNKVDSELEGKIVYNKLSLVIQQYLNIETNFAGSIPEDSQLTKSVKQQIPISILYEQAKATKAYKLIANNVLDGTEYETFSKNTLATYFEKILNLNLNYK